MKMTDIEREPLAVIEWSEPVINLAAEAETVLGYGVLKLEQTEPKQCSTLRRGLAELGIEILKSDQVKAYQTEQLAERTEQKFLEWRKNPLGSFFGPMWEKLDIAQYREPIPEFVLNKAIQIKKAMPEVRIYIEHLTDFPDPFLAVGSKHPDYECLDAELFYVEVWNEPKFEGKL